MQLRSIFNYLGIVPIAMKFTARLRRPVHGLTIQIYDRVLTRIIAIILSVQKVQFIMRSKNTLPVLL